ncbi:hypothetical protein Tco_1241523 [Tanacetum coccineum]
MLRSSSICEEIRHLKSADPSMLTEFILMASYHLCKVIESLALQSSFDSAVKLPRIILYLLMAATGVVQCFGFMKISMYHDLSLVTWTSCLKATHFEPTGHSFHDVALKLVGCFMEEKVEDDDEISYSLPKDKEPDCMHSAFSPLCEYVFMGYAAYALGIVCAQDALFH